MLLLFGCVADPPGSDRTPAESDDYVLTVTGGFGGGTYAEGEAVHVWADVDPQTERFSGWVTPEDFLVDPDEWNSAGVMPEQDVPIRFSVEPYAGTLAEQTFALPSGSRDALVWLPESPRALVLYFHGASYDHTHLRSNAGATIAHQLMADGYAVVAMDSAQAAASGTGGWSEAADLDAVRELVSQLGVDAPVVAMGMSSGGQFAHVVGRSLPADAVVAFCAPGSDATTDAPTTWFLAEADSTWPSGAEDATRYADELEARGIAAEVNVHPATPLYDQRFERVAGIDAAASAAIASEIRDAGFVDENEMWVVPGATASSSLALEGLTDDQMTAVRAEVEIMAAEHELYDDYAARMLAFLRDHL